MSGMLRGVLLSLLLSLAILLPPASFAQSPGNPFSLPATIPVPSWVKNTDWSKPNVHRIDSLIEVYRQTGEAARYEEEQEEEEGEDGFYEEPYIHAYIRWRNEMAPYIAADGTVNYDPNQAREELIRSLQATQEQASGTAAKTTAAASWSVLGPIETFAVGSGTRRNYQSNIYCIAIAPSNPSVLYAGSETGTFYRSADKGLNWTSISETLTSAGSKSIAVDPFNENVVYTYDGSANALMKTTTGGATWSVLTAFTGGTGNAIAINRNTGRILITGTTAIYYSDNGGVSFTAASGGTVTGTLYDLVINPTGTDTVYAVGSTTGGTLVLLRSTNGGTSFSDVTGGLSTATTSGARLAVTPANSSYVYCVNIGNTVPPSVIRSTDRGNTWSVTVASTVTGLTGSSATTGLGMSNGQGYYDLSIVASPTNANHVIVGTTTTYKSTDGGFNFAPVGGYSGPIAIHPDLQQAVAIGGDAYLATDGGVNYSSDFFSTTTNWSVRNNGLRSADYWGFGQGWDEDIVVGGRYHNGDAVLYDVYTGGKALALGGGEDATGHVFHGHSRATGFRDIGNVLVPATFTGPALYSNPSVPNSMWPQDNYYGQFSSRLVTDPRYSNVLYLGKDTVFWRSENCGQSYVALQDFGPGNKVWRFDIARSNPSVIYVCATNGLYKTTNGGVSWATVTLPVPWQYYNSDIVVNPLDENEVFLCMANGAAANKVFRSTSGGATWTNITGAALNGKKVAFLQFQAGTASGVYAVTNVKPSKVYYRDATMADWVDFSNNLPASLTARVGAQIFYRDNKLRLAGNCSVLETPLYTTGAPVAQPMADKRYVGCARDTVNFFDYSMNAYAGATRTWSFPGAAWVSSTSALRPQVVYPGAGAYSVSLTITTPTGTHTRAIDSMVIVNDAGCAPDTVAGLCLQMNGTSQTVSLGTANINSNNFSISCWIQPFGMQKSFSQIVGHPAYPGSNNYGFGFGFKFAGYTPNLVLCYTDSIVGYGNTSTLVCDSTRWNYVVLTYSPDRVVMYLNGIGDTINNGPMPVIDLSQTPFQANVDVQKGQGSKYKGNIDEVKFYNYALTREEVREKMHLVADPATETGLIKYFQFNQWDATSSTLHDVKANFNTFVPSSNIVASTAPVGSGTVVRVPAVSTGGLTAFTAADVDMHLPVTGTYPDGEVVAFHLRTATDTKPDTRVALPGYFIINNYGVNQVVSNPDSMVFRRLNIPGPIYPAGDFRLFKRHSCDFGATWSPELDSASHLSYSTTGSILTYSNCSYDTVFTSQYLMVNNDTTTYVSVPVTTMGDSWWVSDVYPNPAAEWAYIDIVAPTGKNGTVNGAVYSIAGQGVVRIAERLHAGKNRIMVGLPALAPGIYIMELETPDGMRNTRRFMVTRR